MILVEPDGELEERVDDDALGLIKTGGTVRAKSVEAGKATT